MRHRKIRRQLVLFLYGELDSDRQRAVIDHLKQCADCRAELEDLRSFHGLADRVAPSVPESLLREARSQLRGALSARSERSPSWSLRRRFFSGWTFGVAAAAGLACLALGFFVGRFLWEAPGAAPPEALAQVLEDPQIALSNVRFVSGDPDGEMEIAFDAVRPLRLKASADDPLMRRVLSQTLLSSLNPGVRMRAVGLIGQQRKKMDDEVKQALIRAAKWDENSGVRRRALTVLRDLAVDRDVKEALLHVLLHDENPGLRVAAIGALEASARQGEAVDPTLLRLVEAKNETEPNDFVRLRTQAYLEEVRF